MNDAPDNIRAILDALDVARAERDALASEHEKLEEFADAIRAGMGCDGPEFSQPSLKELAVEAIGYRPRAFAAEAELSAALAAKSAPLGDAPWPEWTAQFLAIVGELRAAKEKAEAALAGSHWQAYNEQVARAEKAEAAIDGLLNDLLETKARLGKAELRILELEAQQ